MARFYGVLHLAFRPSASGPSASLVTSLLRPFQDSHVRIRPATHSCVPAIDVTVAVRVAANYAGLPLPFLIGTNSSRIIAI